MLIPAICACICVWYIRICVCICACIIIICCICICCICGAIIPAIIPPKPGIGIIPGDPIVIPGEPIIIPGEPIAPIGDPCAAPTGDPTASPVIPPLLVRLGSDARVSSDSLCRLCRAVSLLDPRRSPVVSKPRTCLRPPPGESPTSHLSPPLSASPDVSTLHEWRSGRSGSELALRLNASARFFSVSGSDPDWLKPFVSFWRYRSFWIRRRSCRLDAESSSPPPCGEGTSPSEP